MAYKKGELYLVNDKGERKASGSYYTPEHIVNYIVENTLDPLVKEAQDKVKSLKPEVDKAIAEWQKLKEQKQGLEPVEKYDRKIAKERERLLEPYLSLKVLDPAMGSGHFLARSTDFLAEAIATDPSIESPIELTEESELTYYRRRVVESCIYGVDLNPLAVELAKLTLWLGTMAKSKPLSFLNHHLRVGNSLIGAKVEDLAEIPSVRTKGKRGKSIDLSRAPVQLGLFQEAFNKKLYDLLQNRALIAQLPTETLEDVHNKEKWERDFEHDVERFRALADLWVSTYFGNSVAWDEYNTLVENLQSTQPEWEKLLQKEYVREALAMREERHFFHWELEFPEVFFDRNGQRLPNPGFSAVVGNPPWGANYPADDIPWIGARFEMGASAVKDSYAVMTERGITILQTGGFVSLITPDTFLRKDDLLTLRKLMLERLRIRQIVETGPLFEDVPDTWCSIWALENAIPNNNLIMHRHLDRFIVSAKERLLKFAQQSWSREHHVAQRTWKARHLMTFGYLISEAEQKIITKMEAISDRLGSLSNRYRISRGEEGSKSRLQGCASASFLMILPEDVERYEIEDGMPISDNQLTPGKLSAFYRHPKIWAIRIQKLRWKRRLIAAFDDRRNTAGMKTLQIIVSPQDDYTELRFLLTLLLSNLLNYWCTDNLVDDMNQAYLEKLPIRHVTFATPQAERERLVADGKRLFEEYLQSKVWSKVLSFVADRLPQKADGSPHTEREQSDVVHDLLAFLAEEMTRLNKEKQAKIKAFLDWLEKEILKGSVENQKNKTKIKGFHESTFEDLLDTLKKNKVVDDPCPSKIREAVAQEFSAAVDILSPLKARIKATDNLIDQIVYKLYGLSDDEIAIVEGQHTYSEPAQD